MNKQLIYFTSTLLLLMAATLSVPAQETSVAPNNTSMNNTTMNSTMNNTTANGILNLAAINDTDLNNSNSVAAPNGSSLSEPVANETATNDVVASQNLTSTANASAEIKPSDNLSENAAGSVQSSQASQEEALEKTSFAIGAGLQSDKVFVVNGNAKPKKTFEAGIPIKSLRDTSKMFFVCDIV